MNHSIVANLRGGLTLTVYVVSLVLAFTLGFLPAALVKLVVPHAGFRRGCTRVMIVFCRLWFDTMAVATNRIAGQRIVIDNQANPSPNGRYLLLGNHQTWTDILVLLHASQPHMPFVRFFLKQQMIWVPIIGFATWALDFPFMKRYSAEQLQQNPELRGKDLETTKRACEIFRHTPSLVINYPEGTRFTAAKHAAQESPYRHLLKPKVGGCAFIVESMGDVLDGMLDLTIAYRGVHTPTMWDFACGRIPEVRVRLRELPVPEVLARGDYQTNADNRAAMRAWMDNYWQDKDQELSDLLDEDGAQQTREAA